MTIHEFGKEDGKHIVLIHPSLVMWDYFERLIPLLEQDYHLIISALPGYEPESGEDFTSVEQIADELASWLNAHECHEIACLYGCSILWQKALTQFEAFLQEMPPYGGIETEKKLSICGALLVFSMASVVPERLKAEELEPLTQKVFMDGFVTLGKIFDLNRPQDIRIIHLIFKLVGKKRQKAFQKDQTGFCTHLEPFDKENAATRYDFTQCPHAEFAKRHDLLHILPAMCNCDFFGIEQIHGTLIRQGTCGDCERCDYCIVGSRNPLAQEYETVRDDQGFLVSVRRRAYDERRNV